MRKLASASWNWFASQLKATAFKNGRNNRLRRNGGFSAIAAEIERLESRELLTVTFHGGALLTAVEAQAVYLGGDWNANASLNAQTGQIDQFVSTLVNSPYMDMLTNAGYNVGRGTASAGAIDNVTLSKVASVGVTDAQIQGFLQAMISAKQVQAPDANRLYVVYVEPGVVVQDGTDASNTTFLGYHSAFGGTNATGQAADIHYAVIPYPGTPNFGSQSQGFASDFDEMTAVSSHEIAEAATDPNVDYKTLGWYDDNLNGEIGDIVTTSTVMSGYTVQELIDQNDNAISPGAGTTPPPVVSVGTPGVSAQALNSTTDELLWNAVSGGPQGYRIYQTIGTQTTLLATVDASTMTYQVSGLPAGSNASFVVEAFNAGSIADSQSVTAAAALVTVSNFTNQTNGLATHVVQNGSNTLVLINESGSVAVGIMTDSTHATVAAWGNDVATFSSGKITWSDGSVWNAATAGNGVTVTNYVNPATGNATHLIQNGTSTVAFVDGVGDFALGTMTDATHATVAAWGNDVATFNANGSVSWSDGTTWNPTTPPTVTPPPSSSTPGPVTVTDYINPNTGKTTHFIQDGTSSVAFIDGAGDIVVGTMIDATHAIVAAWGNDTATFNANGSVTWSDGTTWNATTAGNQVTVTNYVNPATGKSTHLIQNGTSNVAFVDGAGDFAVGTVTDSRHATVAAWGNDVATAHRSGISWSDGTVWLNA